MNKKVKLMCALLICAATLTGCADNASPTPKEATPTPVRISSTEVFYNEYTNLVSIPDAEECTAAQGFTSDSEFCYGVKIKGDNSRAVIYRMEIATGKVVLMKNGDDGTNLTKDVNHANDLSFAEIDGKSYLFVISMKAGSKSLLMYEVIGEEYFLRGNFTLTEGGSYKSASALEVMGVDDEGIHFLFKSGIIFYRGTLPRNTYSGELEIEQVFRIKLTGELSTGERVPDVAAYTHQGMFYSAYTDRIYVPLYSVNKNIILVYNDISNSLNDSDSTDVLDTSKELSFYFEEPDYKLFEIESCVITADGRMYFNTNQSKTGGTVDAFYVFDTFVE